MEMLQWPLLHPKIEIREKTTKYDFFSFTCENEKHMTRAFYIKFCQQVQQLILTPNDKLPEGYPGCGIDGPADPYTPAVGGTGAGMPTLGLGTGIPDISTDKEEVKRISIES